MSKNQITKVILYDLIGSLLLGISVVTFAVNADFAPGGVTGLAVILNFIFDLPIGWMTILINIPIILFTFRKLGMKFFLMSMKSMLIGAFFIDYVVCYLPAYEGSRLVAAILSGICAGIGYSLIFNEDSSTGGTDFIIVAVKRWKPQLSFGFLALIIDGGIILVSVFVFRDIWAFVYGMVFTFITSGAMDATTKALGWVHRKQKKSKQKNTSCRNIR